MKTKPILLCLMMISVSFAGCLGGNGTVVTDEGDPINQPPILSAHIWLGDDDLIAFDGDGTATKHVFLDWFSSDSDGNITSVGVDTDGDGIIDITLPSNSGMFADGIFEFEPGEFINGTIELPLEVGNTIYRAQDWGENPCALFLSNNFFVIAIDDDGATTTEVISAFEGDHNEYLIITLDDVVNGWDGLNIADAFGISANDIAWLSSTTCNIPGSTESLNQYKAEDHPTATTSGSDET